MAIKEAALAHVVARSKREDHSWIKYDSQFSKWKVLIGHDDWENYSVGKEGVPRYKVENLPVSSSPGIYELAICPTDSSSSYNSDKYVVVYVGQADNVRTRLQEYGRNGTHLGRSCRGEKGCGCFQDIFSRGYSIAYRLIPTKNKADAHRKETQLLKTYDYAWNKGSNGARRHDDIIEKLHKRASNHTTLAIFSRKRQPFLQKQVGIKNITSKLLSQDNELGKYADRGYYFSGQVFRFNRSQPRLLSDHGSFKENDTITCGVPLGDGSICRRPPVEGRKRCAEHKGKKTKETSSFDKGSSGIILPGKVETEVATRGPVFSKGCDTICGVEFGDGSFCTKQPVGGRIRCEDHKGMRVTSLLSGLNAKSKSGVLDTDSRSNSCNRNFGSSSSSKSICGATTCDGSFCQRTVDGNGSCWQHVNNGSTSSSSICGALTQDGSSCQRTVHGNGRCWQHSNNGNSSAQNLNYGGGSSSSSSSSICGALTQDGSSCQRTVNGNGRCWQHSNNGNSSAWYLNYGGSSCSSSSSICGAPTQDGFSCQRQVKGNGRCWQHSNNDSCSSSTTIFSSQYQYSNYGGYSASICGAPTRNGSYCRRQVRGNGRCWQH